MDRTRLQRRDGYGDYRKNPIPGPALLFDHLIDFFACINREPFYVCDCPDGYLDENCEFHQQGQIVRLSMGALAAILVCLLVILSEFLQTPLILSFFKNKSVLFGTAIGHKKRGEFLLTKRLLSFKGKVIRPC